MNIEFTNKNVLITGGSRGIGKACALLFAQLNANVIITYKNNKEQAEQTLMQMKVGGNHSAYQLDITQPEAIEVLVKEIITKYSKLDVLVNNAGIFMEHKITETTYLQWQQAWSETMNTNLMGVSNLCFLVGQQMIAQRYGKIVNISSRGAFRGEPDHPAYGASKAGLNAMSQSLAVALAPYNIVVGIIAPGFVETDMAADYLNSDLGEHIKKQSPFNRVASPQEVANLVTVFATDGLEFMTGGVVDLNGASYLQT